MFIFISVLQKSWLIISNILYIKFVINLQKKKLKLKLKFIRRTKSWYISVTIKIMSTHKYFNWSIEKCVSQRCEVSFLSGKLFICPKLRINVWLLMAPTHANMVRGRMVNADKQLSTVDCSTDIIHIKW